jgi:GH24 family phage-related lysozyme (muramidase)
MYLDDAVAKISSFEGRIHWMYLDTRGNVTTGVGQMIPNAISAMEYPFRRSNAELATMDEIAAEFKLVQALKPGLVAAAYRRMSSLLLDDASINIILRATLAESASELSRLFPLFYTYPDPAKVALLDMQFNLGSSKLAHKFSGFCRAVNLLRWPLAAQQCHRLDIAQERNDWTIEQFHQCVMA